MKRREGWILPVLIAVSLLTALWVSGCSSEDDDITTVDPEQIRAAINGFDGANISSLDLDPIVAACQAALPVLLERLTQGDRAARWAAIVALSAVGHQCNAGEAVLPHLKPALDDPDISMRVTAAELVTSFGDKAGIPVLIDAVDSDVGNLRPAEPPTSVCTQALSILGHYLGHLTGQEYTQEGEWQDWWDTNQDSVEWDPDNERFS
jgi:hypothetical protein